jgi:hypothetical protein
MALNDPPPRVRNEGVRGSSPLSSTTKVRSERSLCGDDLRIRPSTAAGPESHWLPPPQSSPPATGQVRRAAATTAVFATGTPRRPLVRVGLAWIGMRPSAISWPPARRAAEANGAAHRFSPISTPAVLPGSIAAARLSTSCAAATARAEPRPSRSGRRSWTSESDIASTEPSLSSTRIRAPGARALVLRVSPAADRPARVAVPFDRIGGLPSVRARPIAVPWRPAGAHRRRCSGRCRPCRGRSGPSGSCR